jgi:predicted phage terminase large subunit-like protein
MRIGTYSGLDALPSSLRVYGASDYATLEPEKGKKEPDFTEHGVWGFDHIGDLWALDWWFDQTETDVGIREWQKLVVQWKPVAWWSEGSLIDKAIGPNIRTAMRHGRYTVYDFLPSIGDKGMKLQAFHARAHAGTVHFPIRRAWTDHVIDQLVKFPGGRWDDAADVCGLIGRAADKMFEASLPPVHAKPLLVPFTEKWIEFDTYPDKPKVRYFT